LAPAFDAAESTAPVNVTVACRVSTLIASDRRAGSEARADLTCRVSAASSAAPLVRLVLAGIGVPGTGVAPFDAMLPSAGDGERAIESDEREQASVDDVFDALPGPCRLHAASDVAAAMAVVAVNAETAPAFILPPAGLKTTSRRGGSAPRATGRLDAQFRSARGEACPPPARIGLRRRQAPAL
jgi:hypothetical protein